MTASARRSWPQGLKVLTAVLPQDVKLETKEYDFGARRYHATGETLTDADLDALKAHDAILLGAIGDPWCPLRRPGARPPAQAPLRLRPPRQPAARRSSSRTSPTPLAGRPEIDFVVVREGTEGPYVGNGGTIRKGTPHEVATEVSVNTALRRRARRPRRLRPRRRPARARS